MYLVSEFRILMPLSMLSLMYGRYTKPPSWRNLAKRPTLQRGSRDAAECADAGCTGATGTRGYGGCAGAAVLGCGRGVPLKTAVESSPWTERGAPKSALTHQKQTPFFSSSGKSKSTNAPCTERHAARDGRHRKNRRSAPDTDDPARVGSPGRDRRQVDGPRVPLPDAQTGRRDVQAE